ncbi:MAG: hypothetical protein Q4C49_07525 [Bacillota bacterium]|nr:hypothetical protein [Bacillota bacterium]
MASKRQHEIKLRLNDEEFEKLRDFVAESGVSREKFMRAKLFGYGKDEKKKRRTKKEK